VGGVRGGTSDGPPVEGAVPSDEPLVISGEIRKPIRVKEVRPDYPEHARRARLEGDVVLEVVVDREGEVESVRVLSGNEIFRRSAVEAVRRWRYRPALQNGTPVKVVMSVIVEFRIR
jgi:protein TonB